ncbi:MAG TPA: AAA family ATPase, partial [Candidatus Limnocylindrales bacterium]|nr:AAA family ATPase [Candidatus Limnocylindrales bacterium]
TFQFETPIGVEAKGKAMPVPARVLIGQVAPAPRPRLPLVGRADDLAQLELVSKRAFGEERPYLVSVIAPAGTGKTRLLEEFLDRLPALADAVVAITQCLPYGQGLTYAPLRSLLLRVLDLRGDPSAEATRNAARDWLEAAGDADAARSADLLVATLGSGEVEGIDRAAIFAAWRSVVERAANQRPLVLVIEDLHWSSDSLLDLIEAILQPRGAAPILMLVLARPELLDRRPTWGGGRRNYVALALEPLGDASVATLVDDMLGQASPEVASRVVARAEGNPFYAGEIVRSILERAPSLEPGAVDAAMASLPDTVQATVLARLDLLEPAARRTLQVGAVFGRAFPVGGLAAVDPALEGHTEGIDQLVERDLIRPAVDADFQFRHILIREVAYGTLPRSERSRLHAAAADFLADGANGRADELAELIAYHYREAASVGSLLGPVPEHVRSAAVTWLRRASDAAMAGAANYEAARHLRSAIDLADAGDLPELYERLGDVLISGDEALEAYDAATRAAKAAGRETDDLLRLLSSQLLVMTRWHGSVATFDAERVRGLLAEAQALVPSSADPRQQARFEIATAFLPHLHHGETTPAEIEAAKDAGNRAVEYARRVGDPNLISEALDSLGAAELELDNYETVVGIARERLKLDDRLNLAERMDSRIVLAWSQATLGQIVESLASAQSVTALLGHGQGLGFQLGALAWQISALHILGRWDEALAVVRRLQEAWIGTDRTAAGYALQGWLAGLEIARARRDGALLDTIRGEFEDLSGRFGEGTRARRQGAMARPDPEAISRDIVGNWRLWAERLDQLDRPILVCSDRRFLLDPEELRTMIAYLDEHKVRVVAAQARRALGLATDDPEPLRAALRAFEAVGA